MIAADSSLFASIFHLFLERGDELLDISTLSLRVSGSAVILACIIGFPIGTFLAVVDFTGKRFFMAVIKSFMAIPPVFVGLLVYLMLSRTSPVLGSLGLLYTPTAMIFAQMVLVLPLVVALTSEVIEERYLEYKDIFASLCFSRLYCIKLLLKDCMPGLTFISFVSLGRAISEVGAVMIVGGNIFGHTRVLTSTIALETSRGNLELSLSLGIILLCITLFVHLTAFLFKIQK